MGSVERVLVLGIVVVIVAILGIAVWGATGDDAGPLAQAATDGGVASADGPASPALRTPLKDAGPAAVDEIARWREARKELREQNRDKPGTQTAAPPAKQPAATDGATTNRQLAVKPSLQQPAPQQTFAPLKPQPKPVAQQPVQPAPAKPQAKQPVTHVVVKGENLWKISYKYFGDSNIQQHLDAILAANPWLDVDTVLQPGMEIAIPGKEQVVTSGSATKQPAVATKASGDVTLYEVKDGDSLTRIASAMLGSSSRWEEIYELNRDRLKAPDEIFVGQTLRLPK